MAAEDGWTHHNCLETPGFPRLLFACMDHVGIYDRPKYSFREFEDHGTLRCEMIVYVRRSSRFPDIQPWNVTATGFCREDTYQTIARKALRYLCQIYEKHLGHTPMRFFPPVKKNLPVWMARLRTLHGLGQREDDPTVLHMSTYLLTLDEYCDKAEREAKVADP